MCALTRAGTFCFDTIIGGRLRNTFTFSTAFLGANASFAFRCTADRGWALVIRQRTLWDDTSAPGHLKLCMLSHYKEWLGFANTINPGLKLNQIVLLTGFDLTGDWAIASFNRTEVDSSITFTVGENGATADWGSWVILRGQLSSPPRFSPERRPSDAKDQCVFIRTFRVQESTRSKFPYFKLPGFFSLLKSGTTSGQQPGGRAGDQVSLSGPRSLSSPILPGDTSGETNPQLRDGHEVCDRSPDCGLVIRCSLQCRKRTRTILLSNIC